MSGAQRAWKIAAATANGDHNTDQAVAKFSDKMAEWWGEQAQSDPVSTAAGIVNTLVTAIAGAESTAATTMGNALTTAVTTIGTADVTGVTTVTNADKTYSTASVGNDKTYLDGMATGEADYLKVVANKWHEFRTDAISAAERDSAISAKWTEFQAAAVTKRNTFRVDQATDAATFRNAVVGAAKTHVDAVTTAGETLNDGLQNAQKTLSTSKWNAWLTASKGLVNLDANSTIAKAESLADAIDELATATENRVYGSSGSGQTQTNWSAPNPFWTALATKADQSAEYIADTKNAERLYYGRSPWSDNVNGAIIEHQFGTRGVLDARRDYEVGMADATATQNKALQHTAGTRDRELAAAAVQLAQSRGAYEISWANLNVESSRWHLDQSALPITGADDGTISVTPDAGTNFVPGWFSVPRLSEAGSSSSTSTGFNATDLDQYFTAGLMPDMPGTDAVSSGSASRNDSRFASALMQPATEDGNQTQPPNTQFVAVEDGDVDPGYDPPPHITHVLIGGIWTTLPVDMTFEEAQAAYPRALFRSVLLPEKRLVPGAVDGSLPVEPLVRPDLIMDPNLLGRDPSAQQAVIDEAQRQLALLRILAGQLGAADAFPLENGNIVFIMVTSFPIDDQPFDPFARSRPPGLLTNPDGTTFSQAYSLVPTMIELTPDEVRAIIQAQRDRAIKDSQTEPWRIDRMAIAALQEQLEHALIPLVDIEANSRFVPSQSIYSGVWSLYGLMGSFPIAAGHVWIQDVEITQADGRSVKAKVVFRLVDTPNNGGPPHVIGEAFSALWTDEELSARFSGKARLGIRAGEIAMYKYIAWSAIGLYFVRPIPSRLYVHLTAQDYAQVAESGLLGTGMPSVRQALLYP